MSFVSGKVALVTGGASGLGFACIHELLKNGLKGAAIADVDVAKGEEVLQYFNKQFGPDRVIFVKTDVTAQNEVEGAFKKTVETFGNLDMLINSAGIFSDFDWERCVNININGTIRASLLGFEHYLPKYKSSDEAIIVNLGSICGLDSAACIPIYSATKYAVTGLSKALGAREHYERTKVRVLTLCPGVTDTPIIHDNDDQYLSPAYKEAAEKGLLLRPVQKPEVVAEGLIKIIEEGETGSFWVIENGRTYEVDIPNVVQTP